MELGIECGVGVEIAPLNHYDAMMLWLTKGDSTYQQIADALGVSRQQVKQRMERIFQQMGADDRKHAIELARIRGILAEKAEE